MCLYYNKAKIYILKDFTYLRYNTKVNNYHHKMFMLTKHNNNIYLSKDFLMVNSLVATLAT